MKDPVVNKLISIVFLLLFASIFASPVIAETVRVPIKLDYPVLRQLMQRQLFNTPDNRVEVLPLRYQLLSSAKISI